MIPKFTASPLETKLIGEIIDRAGLEIGSFDRTTLWMDLEACISNGCPLDLARLRDAPKADFMHDISGIQHHINRQTGGLDGFFLPRTALAQC